MAELLVFLGDIRGTKDALTAFGHEGRGILERRIENLQDSFGDCFRRYEQRSRSLVGLTLSDSVIACWHDSIEGKRFAVDFMRALWEGLDKSLVQFRGFLDAGDFVVEGSLIAHTLAMTQPRFMRFLPVGLAAWSVALAEASHFPDGLFVSRSLTSQLDVEFEQEVLAAGPFEYLQLRIC